MPRMTGFEIMERLPDLKTAGKHKVLVVTGIFKSEKEVQRLKDLGANGYITKTALVDEILFRVNQVFHLGQKNSRRFPRLLISLPIDYHLRDDHFSNYTSNFSAGGAFIRTIDPAACDQHLEINFTIPDLNLPVETLGRVVWTNEYETTRKKSSLPGMGIEFIGIESAIRNSIVEYVDNKLVNEPVWLD